LKFGMSGVLPGEGFSASVPCGAGWPAARFFRKTMSVTTHVPSRAKASLLEDMTLLTQDKMLIGYGISVIRA
jgi:hypothetical protein